MDTEVCSISSGEEVTPPPILRTYELAGKRVQLSEDDLRRLQPKQDLSDAIVEWTVAYILEQRLVNHQRERAYVFPAQSYGTWLATRGTKTDRLRRVEQLAKPSIVMRHRMLKATTESPRDHCDQSGTSTLRNLVGPGNLLILHRSAVNFSIVINTTITIIVTSTRVLLLL